MKKLISIPMFLCIFQSTYGQGQITYTYDPLHRLSGVIDALGNGAAYSYDAAGNIASISRYSSTQVSILQFSPIAALPGSHVTISGTGFSSTAAQDSVSFNGTAAAITSATANQIIATVPVSATTGPIAVTAPSGSATSGLPFTVGSPVTASASPGGAGATLSITTAGQTGTLTFSGTAGQSITILVTGLSIPQSNLSVLKPDGSTLVGATLVAIGGVDLIPLPPLPATGTYTVVITPLSNAIGKITLQLILPLTQAIAPGAGVQVTLAKGQSLSMPFTGTAGQRMSAQMTNITISQSNISFIRPDGTTLETASVTNSVDNDGFLDAVTLPATGTYTLLIAPQGEATGTATVTLYNVVDATTTLTAGAGRVTVQTPTPGQNVVATFAGTAGQSVTLTWDMSSFNIFKASLTMSDPNGTTVLSGGAFAVECGLFAGCDTAFVGNFVSTLTLSVSGNYTILLDPAGSYTGTNYFTLQ